MPFRQIHPQTRIYRRADSPHWQARIHVDGKPPIIRTTGTADEDKAYTWLALARTCYRKGLVIPAACLADGVAIPEPADSEQTSFVLPLEKRRVKCISLWQPYASLMACGAKYLETRGRNTKVRGEIHIHAAQTHKGLEALREAEEETIRAMEKALGLKMGRWVDELPFGAIIARGNLQWTETTENIRDHSDGLYDGQIPFGDFSDGRFAHFYHGLTALKSPIPWKGGQGFFYADI